MPGFIFLDLLVWVLNPGNGEATTTDQDFFINPLFGSLSHDEDVRIHDDAILPFSGYEGITFGNHIYIKPWLYQWAATAAFPLVEDDNFQLSTRLLLHELTHVVQYKALNGSHAAFGWAYLKAFCNVGFSYVENPFEVEAITNQQRLEFLVSHPIGCHFMDDWKRNNWAATLGLPTATEYVLDPERVGKYSLAFQRGSATLECHLSMATQRCVGAAHPA
ncbi:MAG: hypothetical protein LQ346_003868 [Caloplaca aetnensis]|nr:MAG: hypothetical protein LQ346_003868 [Caloplaca aetnensis]